MPLNDDTVLTRTQGVDFTRLDDAHLAIDANAGYCYNLNTTGARIWSLLSEPKSLSRLLQDVAGEYGVPVRDCRDDVSRFVEDMCQAGLIHVADEAHAAIPA